MTSESRLCRSRRRGSSAAPADARSRATTCAPPPISSDERSTSWRPTTPTAASSSLFQLSGAAWSTGDRVRADEALEAVVRAATDEGAHPPRMARAARAGWAPRLRSRCGGGRAPGGRGGGPWRVHRGRRQPRPGASVAADRLRPRPPGAVRTAVEAGEEALVHAIRAADGREEGRIVDGLCSALLRADAGPGRDRALPRAARRVRATSRPSRLPSSALSPGWSRCGATSTRPVAATGGRSACGRSSALRFAVAGLTQVGGEIELLAHEPAAAEQELRTGAEILSAVGGNALQSALLAKALAAQGEEAEADELAHEAETAAGGHEIQAAVIAAATRASVAARRGDPGAAVRIAEAAVSRAERSDAPRKPPRRCPGRAATCLAGLGRSSQVGCAEGRGSRAVRAEGEPRRPGRRSGRLRGRRASHPRQRRSMVAAGIIRRRRRILVQTREEARAAHGQEGPGESRSRSWAATTRRG